MSQIYQLAAVPLTAHSFNHDRTQVAISPNSNLVQIFTKSPSSPTGWTLTSTLSEHDKPVTSIDWAPTTNRLVTCSQDRNAYVWNWTVDPETGKEAWMPTLVLLRLNRSATFVRWSPNEEKFAVASGARTIAVCQFDQESDWWVAKHLKKPLRTTVLSLDWHPNSVLLAAGAADGKARVFSAYMKGIDSKPTPTVWGERLPFNTVCGEFASPAGGWVHGVAFSPSGDVLAFTGHDSTISIVYPSGPDSPPTAHYIIPLHSLPCISLTFISETSLIAAGHDCQPILLSGSLDAGWTQIRSLDDTTKSTSSSPAMGGARTGRLNQSEAFNMFRAADSRGVSSSSSSSQGGGGGGGGTSALPMAGTRQTATGTELLTVHQNTITSVRPFKFGNRGDGSVEEVSTSAVDGKVVVWNVEGGVAGLTKGLGRMGM